MEAKSDNFRLEPPYLASTTTGSSTSTQTSTSVSPIPTFKISQTAKKYASATDTTTSSNHVLLPPPPINRHIALNTDVAIRIGLGVGLAIIVLTVVATALWLRKKKKRRRSGTTLILGQNTPSTLDIELFESRSPTVQDDIYGTSVIQEKDGEEVESE